MNRRFALFALSVLAALTACATDSGTDSEWHEAVKELERTRAHRTILIRQKEQERVRPEVERLSELIAALDQGIDDLLMQIQQLGISTGVRTTSSGTSSTSTEGGGSGGCGSRGGAGYRLANGKCASRRR